MLSEREQQFYDELLKYARRNFNPSFQEITRGLPKPDSKYWRQIVSRLEALGLIYRRNRAYFLAPVGMNNFGQTSFVDGFDLQEMAKTSNIIQFLIDGMTYTPNNAGVAAVEILKELTLDEVKQRLVEAWIIYTFLTEPSKIPQIRLPERDINWAEFMDEVINLISKKEKAES